MGLLFAAIGATVIALVEATLAPYIAVDGSGPHPVLVGGVIWTIAAGIDRGIAWAFVGGVVLDSLLGRALGTTPFAMLVAVGGAALLAQPFARIRVIAPIAAVPLLSIVYSMVIVALNIATQPGVSVPDPLQRVLPGALYDGILGVVFGPVAVTLRDRRTVTERAEW